MAACSRLQDWALLRVDTGSTTAVPKGNSADVKVGERLPSFNVQANHVREFGRVDIAGKQVVRNSGPRIQFSLSLSLDSSGGPLLDLDGKVVGIIGASLTPGARFHHKDVSINPALWNTMSSSNAAVPISVLPSSLPATPEPLTTLSDKKIFTRPLEAGLSFLWGGTSDKLPKNPADPPPQFTTEFRKTQDISVQMMWQKREKNGKGILAAEIFDASNRQIGTVAGKKLSLSDTAPTRLAFSISPASLELGTYRVDVLWNERAVWRTFFSVVE